MALAHHCLKLADQDPLQTQLQDPHFLRHNLSKLGMEDTLVISSSRATEDSTAVKPAAMQV
jgi:hypothetical protein